MSSATQAHSTVGTRGCRPLKAVGTQSERDWLGMEGTAEPQGDGASAGFWEVHCSWSREQRPRWTSPGCTGSGRG